MTQCERIQLYCKEFGSISPMEAFTIGITKLSTRIGEDERRGILYDREWEEHTNRFGETHKYMRYRLKKEQ